MAPDDDKTRTHVTLTGGTMVSHYRIIEKIGAGGMGEVYLAEDTELNRKVALKFLPSDLCRDPDCRARFKREAQAAAKLSHSNIVTIHEVADYRGRPFIAMEYVEGLPLDDHIKAKAPSLEKIVDLAIQICEGLAKAHQAGIVHRDIKPSNILIDQDGRTKILDFGVATIKGTDKLTRTGSTLGTLSYMSPEQTRGEEVDHRSDIFSFGTVLYEMITGQLPFKGDHEPAIIYSIGYEEPEPLARYKTGVPDELQRIVSKALAKDRNHRYQHTDEMLADLKRPSQQSELNVLTGQPSIAVLPFANLSSDPEQEYFCDGMAEEIINALSQLENLRVIARTSAFSFKGKNEDVREIGRKLGVETLLEGSVRKAGDHLRVTAQLVKASDGYHLWSQRFDREMTDVFAIQDEISQAIVEKLRVRLVADRPLVKRYTENLAAYDLCLKARYHLLKMTQEGRESGRRYCEQAIALDPNYALAHVVLCESYLWNAYWGSTDPREALASAKSAALEALRLDDTIADAHSALGTILGAGDFDWHGAEREFRRTQELNASFTVVRYEYAWCYAMWFLLPLGRVEQALTELQRALELDPLDPFYNSLLGCLLYLTRQYESAVAQLQHAIDLDPNFFFSYWFLSAAYALSGRLGEAIAAGEKANELSGGNAMTLGVLGAVYGRDGRTAEARQLLEELTARRRLTYVPASALAFVHNGLGELNESLEWIAKGIEERDPILVTALKIAPTYDSLRSHPAFEALLRKMNLEA